MKKICLFLIFLLCCAPCFAEEFSSLGMDGAFEYSSITDNAFMGQKRVTDEDFQKALEEIKSKKNKPKKKFKGTDFSQENGSEYLGETASKNLLLSIPLELITIEGYEIPIGHYKIVGEKIKNKIYLDFYQAHRLVAKIPATETDNDFDESKINFVKLLPYNSKKVQIIYGSMDFNAYTFIKIKNEISD